MLLGITNKWPSERNFAFFASIITARWISGPLLPLPNEWLWFICREIQVINAQWFTNRQGPPRRRGRPRGVHRRHVASRQRSAARSAEVPSATRNQWPIWTTTATTTPTPGTSAVVEVAWAEVSSPSEMVVKWTISSRDRRVVRPWRGRTVWTTTVRITTIGPPASKKWIMDFTVAGVRYGIPWPTCNNNNNIIINRQPRISRSWCGPEEMSKYLYSNSHDTGWSLAGLTYLSRMGYLAGKYGTHKTVQVWPWH